MEIKIITGVSGAGKSSLTKYFEEEDYLCHDNFPAFLIENYINSKECNKVVFVIDSRTEDDFKLLIEEIKKLREKNIDFSVIYLDCKDSILIKRYKEKKTIHHFQKKKKQSLIESIQTEKNMLNILKPHADYILDTSNLTDEELISKAKQIFGGQEKETNKLMITCMSFGYKHGFPENADILFDARCFKNPYWIPELKEKTGIDKEVQDYIMSFDDSNIFLEKLYDMVDFIVPMYLKEGKRQLIIAIGCTGGHHRSVCFTEKIFNHLKEKELNVSIIHKNIND
jgi:UPF0042 nucleotide-binding protein